MEQSHQVHRRQLHVGRQQLAQGDLQQAIATWKHALESAYAANDFATMFVLARNLGQACKRHAVAVAGDHEARTATLERARDYFQYAFAVLEQCSLGSDVLQHHRVLAKVVRSLERHRAQVEVDILQSQRGPLQEQKQMQQQQPQSPEPQTVHEEIAVPTTVDVCTTCGAEASLGNTIVLDEADGCPYCEACFIEFYESEQALQLSGAAADDEDDDALSSSSSSLDPVDDFDFDDEEEPEPTPSELSLLSEEINFDAQLTMERIEEDDEDKEPALDASFDRSLVLDDEPSPVVQDHTLGIEEAVSRTQLPPASVSLKRTSYPISVLLSLRPAGPSQFECPREIQTSAVYCSPTGSSKQTAAVPAAKSRKKIKDKTPR